MISLIYLSTVDICYKVVAVVVVTFSTNSIVQK